MRAFLEMMTVKKVLALDVGNVRIGVAGNDALGITAQGIETWKRKGLVNDIAHFLEIAKERGAEAFVLGLPKNMDGTEGFQAEDTRTFGDALKEASGLPIFYVDERLTSKSAHNMLHETGIKQKDHKKVVDKIAAVLILETYMQNPERYWKTEEERP